MAFAKKKHLILLGLLCMLLITACTNESTEFETDYSVQDENGQSYDDENEKGASVLKEIFDTKGIDPDSDPKIRDAFNAYDSVIEMIIDNADTDNSIGTPKFEAAYIDNDGIPELLVSYGNMHACGVCIYHYDSELKEAVYLGEFGSFGIVMYYEKHGLVECYYGNNGCFTYYLSSVTDHVELEDAWIIDASGIVHEETAYYHGFAIYEGIDGSRESFEENGKNELYINADDSEDYCVSEDEFYKGLPDWIGEPEENSIVINYDEMFGI